MVTRPTAKKVKSLDELLMADEPTLPIQANDKVFLTITFNKIRPYQNHPFRLYSGERLDDLVESIKANGILAPMIVRKIECGEDGFEYEMLAGHNRMNEARHKDKAIKEMDKLIANRLIAVIKTLVNKEFELSKLEYSKEYKSYKAQQMICEILVMIEQHVDDLNTDYIDRQKAESTELSKRAKKELYLRNRDKGMGK